MPGRVTPPFRNPPPRSDPLDFSPSWVVGRATVARPGADVQRDPVLQGCVNYPGRRSSSGPRHWHADIQQLVVLLAGRTRKDTFQRPAQLSASTRIASTLQHLAAPPSHAASAAGAEACRRATMLSRPRSPRPSRRPSPPTTLLSSPPGMGAAAAEGMSGPRPRGNWGLTWAYAQALTGGREPLMQQSGATVAAVDGSNSWCLNTFRSQKMTNSSPCPSPPPVCRMRRSVDRASWQRTRADRAHQRNLLQPSQTAPDSRPPWWH